MAARERLVRGIDFGACLHRDRLAGQDAPVDQQAVGPRDTHVRGHDVASLEEDDIADHQRRGRNRGDLAVPADPRRRRRRVAQGLERPLAAVLGHDVGADDGQQADEDEQAVADLADEDREQAGGREHEHEWLGERLHHHPPDGLALRLLERVRPGGGGTLRDLRGAQADGRVDAHGRRDRRRVEGMEPRVHGQKASRGPRGIIVLRCQPSERSRPGVTTSTSLRAKTPRKRMPQMNSATPIPL